MTAAGALQIVAPLQRNRLGALEPLLEGMRADPGGNAVLPFGALRGLHFGRVMFLPASIASGDGALPPALVLATNFDGPLDRHLDDLVGVAGDGLDRLFEHARGYPPAGARTAQARRRFLLDHHRPVQAFYVNTVGRSVVQVGRDAELRREIGAFLDRERERMVAEGLTPSEVRAEIQRFVRSTDGLSWASEPVDDGQGVARRYARVALLAVAALAAIAAVIAWPWLLAPLLLFLVLLRVYELGNVANDHRPPNERIAAMEQDEDLLVQNQLTAIGYLQRGVFRRVLIRGLLWALDFGSRNLFFRGHLAGVTTIHFARWVMLDGGRRVVFQSNYDGSPEAYQDDFIGIAFGLNLVFSNGRGWPRSKLLLFGGASDELGFRSYYRDHQIRTQVWFASPVYRDLTAVNVGRNERFRRGLFGALDGRELEAWLRLA